MPNSPFQCIHGVPVIGACQGTRAIGQQPVRAPPSAPRDPPTAAARDAYEGRTLSSPHSAAAVPIKCNGVHRDPPRTPIALPAPTPASARPASIAWGASAAVCTAAAPVAALATVAEVAAAPAAAAACVAAALAAMCIA